MTRPQAGLKNHDLIRRKHNSFLISKAPRLTLGPTQPRLQWLLTTLSLKKSVKVKNECSCISTHTHAFMAQCLIMHSTILLLLCNFPCEQRKHLWYPQQAALVPQAILTPVHEKWLSTVTLHYRDLQLMPKSVETFTHLAKIKSEHVSIPLFSVHPLIRCTSHLMTVNRSNKLTDCPSLTEPHRYKQIYIRTITCVLQCC
jgi:hypothetical protein